MIKAVAWQTVHQQLGVPHFALHRKSKPVVLALHQFLFYGH